MLTRSFHRVFFFLGVLTLLALTRESQATTYYVDYASGNDAKTGKSTAEAWKHCPGGADAASTAASTVLKAGDYVVFKRGVTYVGALITVGASGAQVAAGKDATVNSSGLFKSPSGQFQTKGVAPSTDYVLIYHCKDSVTHTWVESCGLFAINSVNSQTELALKDFTGKAYATPEMAYVVVRPITFKSVADWGSGDAIFTGDKDGDGDPQGANDTPTLFDVTNRKCLRFQDLKFYKTKDTQVRGEAAIISTSGGTDYFQMVGCQFDEIGNSAVLTGSNYGYAAHNTVQNTHSWCLYTCGLSSIQEYNTILGDNVYTVRSGMGGNRYSIIRFNYIKDIVGQWGGDHADSIGFIDGGPNGDVDFGWIYGNTIDNFVEGIALYGSGGGTSDWVIHSNLFISRRSETGKGDAMILIMGTNNLYIFNNTFVGVQGATLGASGAAAIRLENHPSFPPSTNIVIKNNLIVADNGGAINIGVGQNVGLVVENNHHYFQANNSPFAYQDAAKTLEGWKAAGLDATASGFHATRGLTVSPQVANVESHNFSLLPTSPDISAGLDLSDYFTIDKAGNTRTSGAGKWSIGAFCAAPDHQPPTPPLNLAGEALSSDKIRLTWSPSTDNIMVAGYWIFRDNTTLTQVTSSPFLDSNLMPRTPYSYKVVAFDFSGNKSQPSASISVKTQNPPPKKIIPQNAECTEGSQGIQNAVFLLTLSTPSTETITVNYTTRDGTATVADNDYQPAQGKAVFPPGTRAFAIPVGVVGDKKPESDETFYLDLSNPVGAPLDASSVVGTIRTDDAEVTDGLQGLWKFDENSGTTAADSSGKNITGTLTNGPVWKTGRINGAIGFDGVGTS
ncbi:MAG TPA: Calx-beta domain-containing protein, partial [Candidatus Sumerlaeota bacterium]|nr:Calx-beta domain-containing protein [Candidatus Sumerlaeota bacterium]